MQCEFTTHIIIDRYTFIIFMIKQKEAFIAFAHGRIVKYVVDAVSHFTNRHNKLFHIISNNHLRFRLSSLSKIIFVKFIHIRALPDTAFN